MAQKKITDLQQISAITDSGSFPIDNGIQTYRATGSQLKTYLAPLYIAPSYQEFLSTGSFTFNKHYAFVVSSASATLGATYTHNSVTYTVVHTVSSANLIYLSGNGDPLSSGTLTKSAGTGDSTISFSISRLPIYYEVEIAGGGAGGTGTGTSTGPAPVAGGNTTFGSSLLTANGGAIAAFGGAGGVGGAATVAAPARGTAVPGGSGHGGGYSASSGNFNAGGPGGANPLGGAGSGGQANAAGADGRANTGGGGGGSGAAGGTNHNAGCGGGSGGYCKAIIPNPSTQYTGSVGTGGTKGGAGPSGAGDGGNGGTGVCKVWIHYQ